jgi:hypothetical protein
MTITLTSHNHFPETDDNWNVQSVEVTVEKNGSKGSNCLFKGSGTPLKRLTGSDPSLTLQPGDGC